MASSAIFLPLLIKLIPVYLSAALGFIAAKLLKVDARSIAVLIFYLLMPIVIGFAAARTPLSVSVVFLPLISFGCSTFLCFLFYGLSKRLWKDATPNIMALIAGTGNIGYFGLPLATALLPKEAVSLYIVTLLGPTIFESSIGFFMTARGHHTVRECLIKVAKLPSLYAFIIGCIISSMHLPIPTILDSFSYQAQNAYTMLGMMMVGFGLAQLSRQTIDIPFTLFACAIKLIAWPGLVLSLIALDTHILHWYSPDIHHALFILSIVPLAANSVAIATLLNMQPARVAFAVVLSTVLALLYVPLMVMWWW